MKFRAALTVERSTDTGYGYSPCKHGLHHGPRFLSVFVCHVTNGHNELFAFVVPNNESVTVIHYSDVINRKVHGCVLRHAVALRRRNLRAFNFGGTPMLDSLPSLLKASASSAPFGVRVGRGRRVQRWVPPASSLLRLCRVGTASNVASRLCDEAKPEQILNSPRVTPVPKRRTKPEHNYRFCIRQLALQDLTGTTGGTVANDRLRTQSLKIAVMHNGTPDCVRGLDERFWDAHATPLAFAMVLVQIKQRREN